MKALLLVFGVMLGLAAAAAWWTLAGAETEATARSPSPAVERRDVRPAPLAGAGEVPPEEKPPVRIATTPYVAPEDGSDAVGALSVRVRWADSKEPAGGIVLVVPDFNDGLRAVTGSDGRAQFGRVPAGLLSVEPLTGGKFLVEVPPAGRASALIDLDPGATAEGTVVDAGGGVVAGADIWLTEETDSSAGGIVARTGDDGTFLFRGLTPDRWRLIGARAPGRISSLLHVVSGPAGGVIPLRLVLSGPGGRLAGVVEDPQGRVAVADRLPVFVYPK